MSARAALTPAQRIARTAYQVVIAVAVAMPAAIALLPVSAAVSAWAVGITGATAIVVTAAWNAYEEITDKTLRPGGRGQRGAAGLVSIACVLALAALILLVLKAAVLAVLVAFIACVVLVVAFLVG